MVALSLLSLLLASTALATPLGTTLEKKGTNPFHGAVPVPPSDFKPLPSQMTPLTSPPLFTTVGVGVQNYTCTAAGNFSSIGAVAQLFDISTLAGTPEFSTIQNDVFSIWSSCPNTNPDDPGMVQQLKYEFGIKLLGQHFFANVTGTNTPIFDFTASQKSPNARFFGKKEEDVPSPDGPQNVDWLQLANVSGQLANVVDRIETVEGQPPATCKPGSPNVSIKYAALYLFIGSG